MPRQANKECLLLLVDIGQATAATIGSAAEDGQTGNEKETFFSKTLTCLSMILQRKIFSNSEDDVILILIGSNETNNPLAEEGDYKHISLATTFKPADFKLVRYVTKELQPTTCAGDWVDALIVALDCLNTQKEAIGGDYSRVQLCLFTNLESEISADSESVDAIIGGIQKCGVELNIIGPVLHSETAKSETREQGEKIAYRILESVEGTSYSFAEAVAQLMYIKTRATRPTPWNTVLDIGPSIKIPISAYIKLAPAKRPTWREEVAVASRPLQHSEETSSGRVERERTYHRQDEMQTIVEDADKIRGYKYGSKIIPFSKEDEENMRYQSGPRCFSALKFTPSSSIQRHLYSGRNVYYVFPRKGDVSAQLALSSLINAMKEEDLVLLVRRVYNNGNKPKIGFLSPRIKNKFECLVYIELPYADDVRLYSFPSLQSVANTQGQLDAIDALIDSMDLTTADEDEDGQPCEAFVPKRQVNPYFQHVYHVLTQRALDPRVILKEPSETVMKALTLPQALLQRIGPALASVKSNFPLELGSHFKAKLTNVVQMETVEALNEREPLEKRARVDIGELLKGQVQHVGTATPIEDFQALLKQGADVKTVVTEMGRVAFQLIEDSLGNNEVLLRRSMNCLEILKQYCVSLGNDAVAKSVISEFNHTMYQLRELLLQHSAYLGFWKRMSESDLGLISSDEHLASEVDSQTAKTFYDSPGDATATDKAPDVEDLYEELD